MENKYSWDNLAQNLREDALQDTGKKGGYSEDTRFYKLARNENDQGGALVRFIPDADGVMFVKMTKIAANAGHEKRFISDWSPQSIGLPDPVNERFLKHWGAGEKEEAKRFGRSFRYISNIKIMKDPANPENEGKIFLLDMSKTIFEKVKTAAQPSPDEVALGTEPMAVFDPLQGNNFLLKVARASNGFISYETSKFDEKVTAAYKSEADYDKDIKENGYILNDFYKPENFLSYDELVEKLSWYTNEKETATAKPAEDTLVEAKPAVETKVEPLVEAKPAVKAEVMDGLDDLDDLLSELDA